MIDLLSDWQKSISVGLGEVTITEKNGEGEVIRQIIMSTNQFDNMVDCYYELFKAFNPESLIYKYLNRDYVDGDEDWAVDIEVKIERVEEFLSHLQNIDEGCRTISIVKNEHDILLNFIADALKANHLLYFIADAY